MVLDNSLSDGTVTDDDALDCLHGAAMLVEFKYDNRMGRDNNASGAHTQPVTREPVRVRPSFHADRGGMKGTGRRKRDVRAPSVAAPSSRGQLDGERRACGTYHVHDGKLRAHTQTSVRGDKSNGGGARATLPCGVTR